MKPLFYEANLNIQCVGGECCGCISSNPEFLMRFLRTWDHEGSSVSMAVRDYPEQMPFRQIDDPEQVYNTIQGWLNEPKA